ASSGHRAVVPLEAAQLVAQLQDMGQATGDLDVLFKQAALKAQAREEKAQKLLLKGQEGEEEGCEDEKTTKDPEEGAKEAKADAEQERLVASILPELKRLVHVGLVLPSEKELKQKNYTMQRPGLTSIAVLKCSMYYVNWTSLSPWVRAIVKLHGLSVNSAGATQVTFQKFGMDYGFRLAMVLAEWCPMHRTDQPIPNPSDPEQETAVRQMIASARFQGL
ncbi:unnamed protein product, partial [Symbiodinium sp. CCMP2456]